MASPTRSAVKASTDSVDVLVWGGGTGAVGAALQAARSGVTTLLLTPDFWLGGMVSAAGVCCPDGNELTPWQTGLWGQFLRELERREPDGLDHNWVSCFGYRPATAEAILQEWVRAEPKLLWWPDARLLEVERQGSRISAVRCQVGIEQHHVRCLAVIDGSDRGDLLPLAQAPFRLGWESQEQWGEPSAPSRDRLESEPFFREQIVQSPTWVVMGQLQDVHSLKAWDEYPQLPEPFAQACAAFGLEKTITYGRLPGGLVMLNWPLQGNDWHWGLDRAFSGNPDDEDELYQEMQNHSMQFAHALIGASDGWLQLGHAFPEESGSPAPWLAAMPYWREGRRMVGCTTIDESALLPLTEGPSYAPWPKDKDGTVQSIAVGNYANDHHYPGQDWPLQPKSCQWGGRWTGTPFCIPYGALVSADVENLFAADKAISTSHIANGATRLQPLVLNVGQAAGAAAALSVQQRKAAVNVNIRDLQERLITDPQAPLGVIPLWDTPWHHPEWEQQMRTGLERSAPVSLVSDNLSQPHNVGVSTNEVTLLGQLSRGSEPLFQFKVADLTSWSVVTLEPYVNRILESVTKPQAASVTGVVNNAGGWIRATNIILL